MAQERAQSLLVPQSGFFLPHPMHGMPTFTAYQTLPYGRSNHGTGIENRFQDIMGFTQTFTPFANPAHISNPSECGCDYQVVTYEELEKLLPDPKPTTRVELGILPDGSAYAPKTATRENYLLFPSKANYILYFT